MTEWTANEEGWIIDYVAQGRDAYGWRDLFSSQNEKEAWAAMDSWAENMPEFEHRVIQVTRTFRTIRHAALRERS